MGLSHWIAAAGRAVVLLGYVTKAVQAVELLAGARRGREKQDAAVDTVKAMLAAAEAGAGRDLLDDDEVDAAVRQTIDAYVALQSVIAKKRAAVPAPGVTP